MNVSVWENSRRLEREDSFRGFSSRTLGMLIFLVTECMFFAGLLSAFWVLKSAQPLWPPLGQPRLPSWLTLLNTSVLSASGLAMAFYWNSWPRKGLAAASRGLRVTLILGFIFLAIQGYEWARLMMFGLSARANIYGGLFYLLIGAHAVHVVAGWLSLGVVFVRLRRQTPGLRDNPLHLVGMYWLFVVLLWPLLYGVVYF